MHETIFNELLTTWGISKIVQVLVISCIGASIFGIVAINMIPNKLNIEKENKPL